MRHARSILVLLSVLVAPAAPALAQAPAKTDGALIANGRCGRCHATGAKDESPQRGVIPFRRLHERYPVDMLADAVRTGVIAGHDEMPMFEMTPDEVRALLMHIDALAPDKPGYISRVPAVR